jgi:outer membrane receptor protein involved in Fe transport
MLKRTAVFCFVAAVCLQSSVASADQIIPKKDPTTRTPVAAAQKKSPTPKQQPLPLMELVLHGGEPQLNKIDLSPSRATDPASVTVATYPAEVKRSTNSYGDLLRPLTGVTVNTYGQGGLGYGVSIRGFDTLEHGRDVATFIDGVPQNQTSSIQINGYTDLNDLNPELVNGVTLTRGPFDVRAGDFNIGGAVNFTTLDHPQSGLTLMGGQYGTVRGNGIYSGNVGDLSGFASLLIDNTQGYSQNSNLFRINTFDKVLFPMLGGIGALRLQFFHDTAGAPGYISRTLVESGQLSPTATVNSTDGTDRTEANVVFNYRQPDSDQPLSVNLYAIHNVFNRYRTGGDVPVDPLLLGQALSADRRYTIGGNGEKFWLFSLPFAIQADLLAGAGLRSDIANAKQYSLEMRPHLAPVTIATNVNFNIHNPFGFAQVDIKPLRWLKLTGSFRYDEFFFDVHDLITPARVAPDKGAFEPKGGLTITPLTGLDLFANIGQGIRSPSAVFDLPLNPGVNMTTVTSEEVGVQYNSPHGQWHFLGSVYTTNLSDEIEEPAPPAPPINLGPSRRNGFDTEGGYRLLETDSGVTAYLLTSYSALEARLVGNQHGAGTDVPNVPKWLAKYGGELRWPLFSPSSNRVLFLYANQQFLGESELDTAAHQHAGSYSRFNLDAWYSNAKWLGASAFFEATIYPYGRFNETAVEFGSGAVGINPKPTMTLQGGLHLPLTFLPHEF